MNIELVVCGMSRRVASRQTAPTVGASHLGRAIEITLFLN